MSKLDLDVAAEEFEMISSETHLFYNAKTGDFDFYSDSIDAEDSDDDKFDEDDWISAPRQWEIGEFKMMVDFTDTIAEPYKNELLSIALDGKGAFRRFKDTLNRVDLEDEWYAFKHEAYVEIAREWCEDNGIEYTDNNEARRNRQKQASEIADYETVAKAAKVAVTMATLESHNHIVGDIERGVKLYNGGGVEFKERGPNDYWAQVPHKYGPKVATVVFTNDGTDIKSHSCSCTLDNRKPPICRHVTAMVLAIQGGIIESELKLGKTASVSTTVYESDTAKALHSGSLDVLATPKMIALMEQAACECLADCLKEGETSVGSAISIEHTAASPLGAKITATATIEYVFGRKIEFDVTANDSAGEVGKGKHTRFIVDAERFTKKAETRGSDCKV